MPPKPLCFVQLGNTDRLVKISLEDINSSAKTAKTFLKRMFKVQEEPSILYHGNSSNMFLISFFFWDGNFLIMYSVFHMDSY